MDSDWGVYGVGGRDDSSVYNRGRAAMIKINIEPLIKDLELLEYIEKLNADELRSEVFGVR